MSAAPAITKTLLGSTLKLYGIGGFRPEGVNFAGQKVSGRMAGRTRKLLKDKNHDKSKLGQDMTLIVC